MSTHCISPAPLPGGARRDLRVDPPKPDVQGDPPPRQCPRGAAGRPAGARRHPAEGTPCGAPGHPEPAACAGGPGEPGMRRRPAEQGTCPGPRPGRLPGRVHHVPRGFLPGGSRRPLVDRLWFQRCGRQRSGVDRADSNQASGGAAGSPGRPGPEPAPPAWTAVEGGGERGGARGREGRPDVQGRRGPLGPSQRERRPRGTSRGGAGRPPQHPCSCTRQLRTSGPGRVSRAHPAAPGRCTAGPGPDLDGRAAASVPEAPAWPRAARAPPDGPSPSEHPEAMHVGAYLNLGDSQQPRPRGPAPRKDCPPAWEP